MKNYLTFETKLKTTNQKKILTAGNGFGFKVYWRNLGYNPKYIWAVLHKK
jgi:hypothetical protein